MLVGQTTRQQGRLPVETTGFVGREAELARLRTLLGHARLVTVTGPGGVGKTRLALRAAARAAPGFSHGACFVDLSGLRDPGLLGNAVAGALGLPEPGPGAPPDAVAAALRDRHLLLILDTCEHLADACAMLAEAVVAQAPRVTLLATSREPLDVSGENACPVAPLPVPEPGPGYPADYRGTAVDLFLQRAAAAVPGRPVAPGDLPDVIRVCRQLDGIPLAIELAAVRLRALALPELTRRLDRRLTPLTGGHRFGRHRTLRDAIGWSHDLCTPVERALWARLSVFAGPFTMAGAEEVCAGDIDPGQVMPTVIRLVDKSLLTRIDPAAETAGQPPPDHQPTQYQMLGVIREFGAEQLAVTGAAAPSASRLVGRYLALARRFRDHSLARDQLPALRELRREHANVLAALEYALGDQAGAAGDSDQACAAAAGDQDYADAARHRSGVELATALCAYWRACAASDGSYWLGRAVKRAPAGSPARARALLARAQLLTTTGRAAQALAAADEALGLAATLGGQDPGDKTLVAHAHLARNAALAAAGRLAAATAAGAEARRRLTALNDQAGLVRLDIQLTYLALLEQDAEAALAQAERGLRRLSGSGERWLQARLHLLSGLALYLTNRDIESSWAVTRALQVAADAGDTLGTACTLEVLGWLAARSGSQQRAAWLLGGAEPLWRSLGGRLAVAAAFERPHDDTVTKCTAALGYERFTELSARGARQPLAAVVAFARSDSADPADDDSRADGGDDPGAGSAAEAGARLRLPGQLTVREREIAGLVAAGLSNRQIAERLVISRRTVDAHLEHIFGKLGITSRVLLTIQLRDYSAEPASDANA